MPKLFCNQTLLKPYAPTSPEIRLHVTSAKPTITAIAFPTSYAFPKIPPIFELTGRGQTQHQVLFWWQNCRAIYTHHIHKYK